MAKQISNEEVLRTIEHNVQRAMPEVRVRWGEPAFEDGIWQADFLYEERAVAVQPEAINRIGVTVFPSDWGVAADEYFDSIDSAVQRVIRALSDTSEPALGRLLRELRKHGALSQADVAELLDIQQPAVSKLERRDDVTVRMLARIAKQVGARLSMCLEIGGRQIVLDPAALSGAARGS